jgi:hypothetical protein
MDASKHEVSGSDQPEQVTDRYEMQRVLLGVLALVVIVLIVALFFNDDAQGAAAYLGVRSLS